MSEIYLMRHGMTEWNAARRRQGRLDSPLTEEGRAHARRIGNWLASRTDRPRIESSPIGRARETATVIAGALSVPDAEVQFSPLLAEAAMGEWEGLTHEEIEQRYPGELARRDADKWHYRFPGGGETYAEVNSRAEQWLLRPFPDVTVVITHEMISRTIQGTYLGLNENATLDRDHPHTVVYLLSNGQIEPFDTSS